MKCAFVAFVAMFAAAGTQAAVPQATAFTYQGQLGQNGTPTSGSHDLSFALFDAAVGGTQIGSTIAQPGYPIANGVFTIDLDFGFGTFTGKQLYLAVTVDGNALSPRQPVNSVPVAQYAMSGPNSPSSTASAASATQFQNDRLYAGVSVNGENLTMVMTAKPAFSPSGTSTVPGYGKAIDVYSVTSGLAIPVTISPSTVGKASAPDVRVLARIDSAYTGLVSKLVTGASYTGLQIDVLNDTGAVTKSYCYGGVFVTGLQPMPQAGVYEITLVPGQFHHRVANPASPGTFFESGWSFVTNAAPAATSCVDS